MSIGIWQLLLIVLIVLIFFGAGKLPKVMGDLGKGVRSLKDGMKEEEKENTENTEEAKEIASNKSEKL